MELTDKFLTFLDQEKKKRRKRGRLFSHFNSLVLFSQLFSPVQLLGNICKQPNVLSQLFCSEWSKRKIYMHEY